MAARPRSSTATRSRWSRSTGPGLLWRAAGVLASHRLTVRGANATARRRHGGHGVQRGAGVRRPAGRHARHRRTCGGCSRAGSTSRTGSSAGPGRSAAHGFTAPPPKVTLVDNASTSATVVEVRAHDEPGLLWRIGRALGECGLNVHAARVETLGAEAVDVFYVTDADRRPAHRPRSAQAHGRDGAFRAQPGLRGASSGSVRQRKRPQPRGPVALTNTSAPNHR